MKNIEALKRLLIVHEGLRSHPYRDTEGVLTIGVGHNLDSKGLSMKVIQMIFEEDLEEVLGDLMTFEWWEGLSEKRQCALADLRFNLGPDKFRQFKRTLAAIAAGDFESAADHLEDSKWYGQVRRRGPRIVKLLREG